MSLVYVTGLPGMGKTSVFNEVCSRGATAYGVDEHNLADWLNKSTGNADEWPKPPPADFEPHQWYKTHNYVLSERRLRGLRDKSDSVGATVYIFGTAGGLENVRSLFSRIFALYTDDLVELKRRIDERNDVPFGKTEEEFAQIAQEVETAPNEYQRLGATILNAKEPIKVLADELINLSA
jgi:hypothetical protein